MGQRGNYIIKSENKIDIFYTNTRSNLIPFDLSLGSSKFIEFVRQLDKVEELLNTTWIDGCVFIDLDSKELLFWEFELLYQSSVRKKYLEYIQSVWRNWKLEYAEKEMYDIEKRLNINYVINQKDNFVKPTDSDSEKWLEELKVKDDELEEYMLLDKYIVVIKKEGRYTKKDIYNLGSTLLVALGEKVIPVLEIKPTTHLEMESKVSADGIIVIDCDNKILLVNEIVYGLTEVLMYLWKDWKIDVANCGYIKILEKTGVDTSEIRMTEQEIDNSIQYIFRHK